MPKIPPLSLSPHVVSVRARARRLARRSALAVECQLVFFALNKEHTHAHTHTSLPVTTMTPIRFSFLHTLCKRVRLDRPSATTVGLSLHGLNMSSYDVQRPAL